MNKGEEVVSWVTMIVCPLEHLIIEVTISPKLKLTFANG